MKPSEQDTQELRTELARRYPEEDVDRALRWATQSARGMAEWVKMPQLYQEILPAFLNHAESVTARVPDLTRRWLAARGKMKRGYAATPFGEKRKRAYNEALDEFSRSRPGGEGP
ncbi:MAG: hypothetical protein Q8O40_10570 [Chloroflexota bacterium]|nr:hypothetical protein [Chloroflexota bacterium]